MTWRAGALSVAALVLAVAAAVAIYSMRGPESSFTLLLRCDDDINGEISISREERTETAVGLASACRSGSVQLDDYDHGQDLVVAIVLDSSGPAELKLIYADAIQSTPDGYFAMAKITAEPPFIVSDRL